MNNNMDFLVENLELPTRADNCLKDEGIYTIRQLLSRSQEDLLTIRNFGQTSLRQVNYHLKRFGFPYIKTEEELKTQPQYAVFQIPMQEFSKLELIAKANHRPLNVEIAAILKAAIDDKDVPEDLATRVERLEKLLSQKSNEKQNG